MDENGETLKEQELFKQSQPVQVVSYRLNIVCVFINHRALTGHAGKDDC